MVIEINKCILEPPSRLPAAGSRSVRPITSQFMAKYDNREDQRIAQIHSMATLGASCFIWFMGEKVSNHQKSHLAVIYLTLQKN